MRLPHPPRRVLRFGIPFAAIALLAAAAFDASVGCGPDQSFGYICFNPVTHKEDGSIGDPNHYVNGVYDPCNCYDPCGPAETCPIVVDAGPLPPGCDAGVGAGGSDGG